MEEISVPGPVSVPKDLTKPSRHYTRRVWLALAALLAFIALYLALTGWFVWSSYRLLAGAFGGGSESFKGLFVAVPMLFLSVFMLKALLFREKKQHTRDFEIKPEEEPRLFQFLYRIADEAGAPRPHRVFLSPQVNAGVLYDLSVLNLIFPSKKNLDIGLGLVNALSLAEIKAVLAHEFGHFGQRAMAVGRWVYVGQRIAAHIVHKRDALDTLLRVLSGVDLRIAWIGWLMRIVIWSLRAVLDTVFSIVVVAERALSREMEMQADLVAVSLTGSDALVHALHKLGAADAAWDQALGIAAERYAKGKAVPDLFALHSRVVERARHVLADENHGRSPPRPEAGREQHRVFEQRIAEPPRMWSSHPPNREREDNAKRFYVACDLDERPAWCLFRDPDATRGKMTEFFLSLLETPENVEKLTKEASIEAVDENFDIIYLDPRYRGAYLRRSVVRSAKTAAELYLPPDRAPAAALSELYPERLRQVLERWKSLENERAMLEGLQRGLLQAGGGSIQFRGDVLRRKDLPRTLEKVKEECAAARSELDEFDRQHRSAHLLAAERLGRGWPEYLRSLLSLLHYADHTEANIRDARAHLANVFAVVTADGRVSSSEAHRLAVAGTDVYWALQQAFDQRIQVVLPAEVAEALGVKHWADALPDHYQLQIPNSEHIGDWLQVVDSWLDAFIAPLDVLERSTLEALLKTEAKVSAWLDEPDKAEPAPEPASVPEQYATLLPGAERERQWRLDWWDRFQVAEGFLPSTARFCVASGFVAAMIFAGASVGESSIAIYNGLGRSVVVHVGDYRRELRPFESSKLERIDAKKLSVRAETLDGELIESFDAELPKSFTHYVYNVAGAAPLVSWTAVYGEAAEHANQNLGNARWSSTDVDHVFEEPPKQVSTKGKGSTRSVLSGAGDAHPAQALNLLTNDDARVELIRTRAEWDEDTQPHTAQWMEHARGLPDCKNIFARRLERNPREIVSLRAEQDCASDAEKPAVCARHQQLALAAPNDGGLQYLAIRCRPKGEERERAFLAAYEKNHDDPWLAMMVGYQLAKRADWEKALDAWDIARANPAIPEYVTIDTARILRLGGADSGAHLKRLAETSVVVRRELALESGEDLSDSLAGYTKLSRGQLSEALAAAAAYPKVRPHLLRLVAASKGALETHVSEALKLGLEDGIDGDTIWPAIGLLIKHKQDAAPLIARLEKFVDPDELTPAKKFVDPEQLLKNPEATDALADQLEPATRAHAYVMACVILGDAAPEPWLLAARALLFADERPFL